MTLRVMERPVVMECQLTLRTSTSHNPPLNHLPRLPHLIPPTLPLLVCQTFSYFTSSIVVHNIYIIAATLMVCFFNSTFSLRLSSISSYCLLQSFSPLCSYYRSSQSRAEFTVQQCCSYYCRSVYNWSSMPNPPTHTVQV